MPVDAPAHVFAAVHNCNPGFACDQMPDPQFQKHHVSEVRYPEFLVYDSGY